MIFYAELRCFWLLFAEEFCLFAEEFCDVVHFELYTLIAAV